MVTFGPWAAGEFVRSRRLLAAKQLHDTVAHWLTAVVIQARAGQVRSLTQQGSVAATFADIAHGGRPGR